MEMIFKLSHTNLGHNVFLTNRNDTPGCEMFNTFSVTLTIKLQACVLSEINSVYTQLQTKHKTHTRLYCIHFMCNDKIQCWNALVVFVCNQLRFSRIDFVKQFWVYTNSRAKYKNTVVSLRMSRYPTSPYQDPNPDKNRTCCKTLRLFLSSVSAYWV